MVGYPLLSDEELTLQGYHDSLIMAPIIHSEQRDILNLLVEEGFFSSRRLAREGTPSHLHRVFGAEELDILEWKRKQPYPLGIDIVVGFADEAKHDSRVLEVA